MLTGWPAQRLANVATGRAGLSIGELFTLASYVVGALVFFWAARQRRMATQGMGLVVLIGFFCGIIGAKLTQLVAEGWPFTIPVEAIADPRAGGRALLGGVIFGWIGVEIAKRRLGIKRSTGDLFALALPAGEAIGRIGCYFNGCCYGSTCDLPWAVEQHAELRHPSQLFSSVVAAMILGVLLWVRKHRTLPEGALFRLYLVLFGSTRFLLEFTRYREALIWGLSSMQWLCLELVLSVAIYQVVISRRVRRSEA